MSNATLTANPRFSRVVYPPKRNRGLQTIAQGSRVLLDRLLEARRYYAIRNTLQARSDRVLADIGITRDEIPAFARQAASGR